MKLGAELMKFPSNIGSEKTALLAGRFIKKYNNLPIFKYVGRVKKS